jgi:hypothetical protein
MYECHRAIQPAKWHFYRRSIVPEWESHSAAMRESTPTAPRPIGVVPGGLHQIFAGYGYDWM